MTQEGKPNNFQDNSRLWTIEDAKIGDILTASDKSIFIYAGLEGVLVQSYIALLADGDLNTMKCNWEEKTSVAPATREQRELLLKKMKETGYQWNAEKKELKKINEKDMDEQFLRKFLKEHLSIQVWCDYDGCDSPQINVGLYLDNEEIGTASDYLITQ